jgi:hypothetical protein
MIEFIKTPPPEKSAAAFLFLQLSLAAGRALKCPRTDLTEPKAMHCFERLSARVSGAAKRLKRPLPAGTRHAIIRR